MVATTMETFVESLDRRLDRLEGRIDQLGGRIDQSTYVLLGITLTTTGSLFGVIALLVNG